MAATFTVGDVQRKLRDAEEILLHAIDEDVPASVGVPAACALTIALAINLLADAVDRGATRIATAIDGQRGI